jgi:hypothetical protein
MNMEDEAGLGFAIHWVQKTLITAYGNNCPLRPVKTGRCSLKWTAELESLRRGVRRLSNKSHRDKIRILGKCIERLSGYREEVRKASKETWRTFCSSINNLPRSARLHGALSRDPTIRLGSLMALPGRHMQSEGETLDFCFTRTYPTQWL